MCLVGRLQVFSAANQLLLTGVFAFCFALPAYALDPVYTKDSARDIFSRPIKKEKAKDAIYLRPRQLEDTKAEEPVANDGEEAPGVVKAAVEAPTGDNEALDPKDRILKEFGDPEKTHPVKAVDNAPAPFRAMLEAIKIGDRKLAMKYAIQYTRYREELARVQQEAMAISGQAKIREGVLPPDAWPNSPDLKEYHYLQNIDLEAEDNLGLQGDQRVSETARRASLLKDTQEILQGAFEQNYGLFKDSPRKIEAIDSVTLELDEEEERQKARQRAGQLVPKDPQGKVQILYFLDLNDEKVMGLADDIERLYKSARKEKANFMAFTLNKRSKVSVSTFKRITGTSFPITDGGTFSAQLKIKKSPTTVFVAGSTGQSYIEEGLQNFYYLDEIMKMMQGA